MPVAQDQFGPGDPAVEDVSLHQTEKAPALQMSHQDGGVERQFFSGTLEPVSQLDVFNCGTVVGFIEPTGFEENRFANGPAAAPKSTRLAPRIVMHITVHQILVKG